MFDNNLTSAPEITEFSVTEIANKIKSLLEDNLGYVRIKGEISGLKIATSGHGYFGLKDAGAVLAATCWRHNLSRVQFKISEGLEVIVIGKITAYAGQSKYQISVDNILPSGTGAFMQLLKERRDMLTKEGLFLSEHKMKIPFMPKTIGIVTSITGSVIQDIIHRISDRCPVHLIVWPVTVQGGSASLEITEAINGFNLLADNKKPDLIIVARGGGSIEDLWPFNEENVVRAAFNSQIPLISAVGHETDYTLIDLVADVRAPTPTAAAEFAVPVISGLKQRIISLTNYLERTIAKTLEYRHQLLSSYDRILRYPINYLANNIQKTDNLGFRLAGALPNLLRQKQLALKYFPTSRTLPSKIINYKMLQLNSIKNNFLPEKLNLLANFEHRFNLNASLLSSLDYNNVLKRGYAMIKSEDEKFISSKEEAKKSSKLKIKLFDGEITVNTIVN
jgi:exodeoxyribonuclease VII large subunit